VRMKSVGKVMRKGWQIMVREDSTVLSEGRRRENKGLDTKEELKHLLKPVRSSHFRMGKEP